MIRVRLRRPHVTAANELLAAAVCLLLALLLTACGSTSGAGHTAAAAAATPTCPPAIPTKVVVGTVKSISKTAFTVVTSSGTTTTVDLASTTRISRQVQASVSAISTGTGVQVTTDSSGVTAERIVVITGNPGAGSRTFGRPSGTPRAGGTPPARGNAACFRRGNNTGFGQGTGQGQFSGLRGTVTMVSSSQLSLTDSQGQTLTVTITPSTVIISTTTGQVSNLSVGASVIATGTTAEGGITARTVMIDLPSTTTS